MHLQVRPSSTPPQREKKVLPLFFFDPFFSFRRLFCFPTLFSHTSSLRRTQKELGIGLGGNKEKEKKSDDKPNRTEVE